MNLLKDSQEQSVINGKALHLSDLGMNGSTVEKYRTTTGATIYVKVGNR